LSPLVHAIHECDHYLKLAQERLDQLQNSTTGGGPSHLTAVRRRLEDVRILKAKRESLDQQARRAQELVSSRQIPAARLAFQLTLMDFDLYRRIQPQQELAPFVQHWISPARREKAPNISAVTDWFNYVCRWVQTEVIAPKEPVARAQVIGHWIAVARGLDALQSFNMLKAVISGLEAPPVRRLQRAWAVLPKKQFAMLNDLAEVSTPLSSSSFFLFF
jgi:hypothetical protein